MANQVIFEIDDETKRMTAGEMLVTGSTYDVVLSGVTYAAGTSQVLTILNEKGELLAFSNLTAGTGTLSTNTQEIAEEVENLPTGAVVAFTVLLHSAVAGAPENVATGRVAVRCTGKIWSNDTTGAPMMYKGDKGDTGNSIAGISDNGTDEYGNRKVKVTYTNGGTGNFTAPRGRAGADYTGMVAFYPTENGGDGKWHKIELTKNSDNAPVLAVDESEVESPAATVTSLTEDSIEAAAASAAAAAESATAAAASATAAAASATAAAASATAAGTSETNAGTSATAAAASATAAGTSATNAGTSATAAQTSAAAAASAASASVSHNRTYDITDAFYNVPWEGHEPYSYSSVEKSYFTEIARDRLDPTVVWGKWVICGSHLATFYSLNMRFFANRINSLALMPFDFGLYSDRPYCPWVNIWNFTGLPAGIKTSDVCVYSYSFPYMYDIMDETQQSEQEVVFGAYYMNGTTSVQINADYLRLEIEGYYKETPRSA